MDKMVSESTIKNGSPNVAYNFNPSGQRPVVSMISLVNGQQGYLFFGFYNQGKGGKIW